ncbi:MAG: hypothetical protein EOO34_00820 [Cyanobacteriota bacterium]|nr:MAG: hypothetical protein EOO34_00820 [Cyanobacteriota bacterium]
MPSKTPLLTFPRKISGVRCQRFPEGKSKICDKLFIFFDLTFTKQYFLLCIKSKLQSLSFLKLAISICQENFLTCSCN